MRYGTRTFIGADRGIEDPTKMVYDTKRVVALSVAELARYRREYRRAIRNGSLTERKVSEWTAQNKPATKRKAE